MDWPLCDKDLRHERVSSVWMHPYVTVSEKHNYFYQGQSIRQEIMENVRFK